MELRRLILATSVLSVFALPARAVTTCSKDYPELKDQEMSLIDVGSALEESVDDISQLKTEQRAIVDKANNLLESRTRIADDKDVQIIDRARLLLGSERIWNRADNRQCHTGDTKLSLFCALEFASRDVTGEYRHRRTALEEVRLAVEDASKGRQYEHRLMEFNNDPRTKLRDVWGVLAAARSRLVGRLALQRACKL